MTRRKCAILFVYHIAGALLLCSCLWALPLCTSLGIMAILFSGIVMSHYTHHNLSPVTQILMQQTLRTVAFLCGEFCPRPVVSHTLFSWAGEAAQFLRARRVLPYLLFITLACKFPKVNLTPSNFLEHLMPIILRPKMRTTDNEHWRLIRL